MNALLFPVLPAPASKVTVDLGSGAHNPSYKISGAKESKERIAAIKANTCKAATTGTFRLGRQGAELLIDGDLWDVRVHQALAGLVG